MRDHPAGTPHALAAALPHRSRRMLPAALVLLLCVTLAAAAGLGAQAPGVAWGEGHGPAAAAPETSAGKVTLPAPADSPVLDSLVPNLVNHWNFENPVAGNAAEELDLGFSGTDLWLVNGGGDMRVQDGAYPASTFSLQTQQVNPTFPPSNEDWKAGVYDAGGVATLDAYNAVQEITIMGWFKQTGANPSRNTNSPNPNAMFNAVGLAGVLSGDSAGHAVRALLEVISVSGELRVVALARRIDGAASNTFAASDHWLDVFPPGEWVHLAATFDFDDGTMGLYRNGQPLDGFYTNPGDPWDVSGPGPHFSSPTNPTGIKIGGSFPQNTGEQNPCNCRMDELKFFDRVLTDEEMAAQYALYQEAPVELRPANAGRVVPLEVAAAGEGEPTVESGEISCESGQPLEEAQPIDTPGGSGVRYDPGSDAFHVGWQTSKAWAGTCRQLVVTSADGSVSGARFQFH